MVQVQVQVQVGDGLGSHGPASDRCVQALSEVEGQCFASSSMTRLIGLLMTSSGTGSLARIFGRSFDAGFSRARSSACCGSEFMSLPC